MVNVCSSPYVLLYFTMQSPLEMQKTTRSRTRSMGGIGSTPKNAADNNLNGEKVNGNKDTPLMEVDKPDTESTELTSFPTAATESKDVKPAKGRKRKASELKNDSISEEPPAKDKPPADDEVNLESIVVKGENLNDDDPDFDEKSQSKDTSLTNNESLTETLTPEITDSLGKGKRARIPNKRYSDFPLRTPVKLSLSENEPTLENGEKENIDSGSNTDASENSGSVVGSPSVSHLKVRKSASASPATSSLKKKSNIDLTNPNYLKPFQYGWKRELVYRAVLDGPNIGRRNGDIYYYTPNGRKVRSMREVSEHLKTKELTLDDFTFTKEPLGLDDPEKEIIRDAKNKSVSATPLIKRLTPKVTRTPKVSSPKSSATSSPTPDREKDNSRESVSRSSPRTGSFRIKLTRGSAAKSKDKKSKDDDDADMEHGTYPPNWSSPTTKKTAKTGKGLTPSTRRRKRRAAANKQSTPVAESEPQESRLMSNYLQSVAYGYNTLLYIFQYLKVQDLLHASCVCSMWRDIASHTLLWKTVRMKNSQIHSFEGLADALQKHGTIHLDLRKMLLPNNGNDDIWQEFSREIKKVESLKKIELCRCPATVVEQLALSNPKLEVINAVTIKCESMSLAPLVFLKSLQELRLKSTAGFSLTSDLTALADLKELTHLSLTSIKDLNKLNINVIAELKNLESLDLGECADFPKTFGSEILIRLCKLEKLRLEKGQGNCYTFEILDAVKSMPHLEQLELVNFDIKAGFDKALGSCENIKKLLIIPTYISQSATTNHMVLGGVLRLQNNLSHFVWGITLELLRVTELFVDQCEDADKKDKKDKKVMGNGDSIPVLKPVPLLKDGTTVDIPPAQDPPQVEILPLPNLQKLLLQSLPTTRVKILKIPFHATWRQSITDTVN